MQYKILNDVVFTNNRLAKIGYVPNDLCTFWGIESETLCHLFYECFFWFLISGKQVKLTLQDVLLGILDTDVELLNHFITLAKLHIWISRKRSVAPNLTAFKENR